jgi:uncharacterized protein (TIGR02118 family)
MIRVSALYPNEQGSHFDRSYYVEHHEPFAQALLQPFGLDAIRTTIGVAALDGNPPAFWAISEMTFVTRERFATAMDRCGERLFADIANYTNVAPILQFSELGANTRS